MLMFDRRSKVSLKVDNSQCAIECFTSETAAEFISQSLRKGQYKPIVPVASVQGMILFILYLYPSQGSSDEHEVKSLKVKVMRLSHALMA